MRAGALCTGVCVLGAAISDCAVGKAREAAACAAGGGGRGLRWARGAAASWCQRAATAARVVAKRATGVGKRCSTKRFVCGMLVGSILLAGVVGPVEEWDAVEGASLPTVVSFGKVKAKEQWIGVEVKAKAPGYGVEALGVGAQWFSSASLIGLAGLAEDARSGELAALGVAPSHVREMGPLFRLLDAAAVAGLDATVEDGVQGCFAEDAAEGQGAFSVRCLADLGASLRSSSGSRPSGRRRRNLE